MVEHWTVAPATRVRFPLVAPPKILGFDRVFLMVPREGVGPPTLCLERTCSIQLSYRGIKEEILSYFFHFVNPLFSFFAFVHETSGAPLSTDDW